MKMIVSTTVFLLLQVWMGSFIVGSADMECCYTKDVGGIRYVLEDTEDTSPHNCNSNCVYKEVSDPDSIYCFRYGDLPASCLKQKAPIITKVPIDEGGESYEQENHFHEETGSLIVKVPAHKNYTDTTFFLHQNSDTLLMKTDGICHLTDLHDHIDVSTMAEGFNTHNRMRVSESNSVTTYLIKSREARYGAQKRADIMYHEADDLCKDTPVVTTNDMHVTKDEYERFNRGEVIIIDDLDNMRQNKDCVLKSSTTKVGRNGCGYSWANPAGGSVSTHEVTATAFTVTCAIPRTENNNMLINCEGYELDFCQCKIIKDKTLLQTCYLIGLDALGIESTIKVGDTRSNLIQTMLFNSSTEGNALVITGPAYKDYEAVEVVMHAHKDGWWHETHFYHGTLKNNKLLKIGEVCHITNLPYETLPLDIAIGINEIKKGNDVTTEEDEEVQQEIMIPDGALSSTELDDLHSILKEKCKDSNIEKYVPASDEQKEVLANGGVIILGNGRHLGYAAIVTDKGAGSWRFPNNDNTGGAKLWINQIVSPVLRAACCLSETCVAMGSFCACDQIDSNNFDTCHNKARKAKQLNKHSFGNEIFV